MNQKQRDEIQDAHQTICEYEKEKDLDGKEIKQLREQVEELESQNKILMHHYDFTVGLVCCDRELNSLPDPDKIFFKIEPIPDLQAIEEVDPSARQMIARLSEENSDSLSHATKQNKHITELEAQVEIHKQYHVNSSEVISELEAKLAAHEVTTGLQEALESE